MMASDRTTISRSPSTRKPRTSLGLRRGSTSRPKSCDRVIRIDWVVAMAPDLAGKIDYSSQPPFFLVFAGQISYYLSLDETIVGR